MRKISEHQKHAYLTQLFCYPMLGLLPNTHAGNKARQMLADKTLFYHYPRKSLIFLQHTPVTHLYFLMNGQVSCHRSLPNGQERLIHHYHTLSLINEYVLWQDHTELPSYSYTISTKNPKNLELLLNRGNLHQLTAKATESTIIATIPALDYFYYIKSFELGELFSWFTSQVSKLLYQHLVNGDLLTFNNAKAKVSYYLLSHFLPHKAISFNITQKQLASQIGMRAETLSRTLNQLSKQRLIEPTEDGYAILDVDGMLSLINE